jgi:hypothetical protein
MGTSRARTHGLANRISNILPLTIAISLGSRGDPSLWAQ